MVAGDGKSMNEPVVKTDQFHFFSLPLVCLWWCAMGFFCCALSSQNLRCFPLLWTQNLCILCAASCLLIPLDFSSFILASPWQFFNLLSPSVPHSWETLIFFLMSLTWSYWWMIENLLFPSHGSWQWPLCLLYPHFFQWYLKTTS